MKCPQCGSENYQSSRTFFICFGCKCYFNTPISDDQKTELEKEEQPISLDNCDDDNLFRRYK